jgi:hypothetical protein
MSIHSIALLLSVIIILITSIATFPITTSNAQQQQQVKSANGGLTATLNGDSFRPGDAIIVNGTVEKRQPSSNVAIEVIDPQNKIVENGSAPVTAPVTADNNTFSYRFIAGEQQQQESDDPNEPMITSGNYTMTVRYFPPPSNESDMEQVELFFEYNAIEEGMTVGGTSTFDDYDADTEG